MANGSQGRLSRVRLIFNPAIFPLFLDQIGVFVATRVLFR